MSAQKKLVLYDEKKLEVTLRRLCYALMENHGDFSRTVIIGIQPRGVQLSKRIHALLHSLSGHTVPYGELDVTFFRDDFRRNPHPLQPNTTRIDFLIEGKEVILVDDVLYTGRTIRAAMDAMLAYGRPEKVELLVLVDRRHHRDLPIEPDYCGIRVDSLDSERVMVRLREGGTKDSIWIETRD